MALEAVFLRYLFNLSAFFMFSGSICLCWRGGLAEAGALLTMSVWFRFRFTFWSWGVYSSLLSLVLYPPLDRTAELLRELTTAIKALRFSLTLPLFIEEALLSEAWL